jgi:Phage integrase family
MPFSVHHHMLRHGWGYTLANAGHDTRALQAWLGHKNIQHTVRYTELAPTGSKSFGGRREPARGRSRSLHPTSGKGRRPGERRPARLVADAVPEMDQRRPAD